MTDLAEALSRMFDWFADTFKKQKEQSKSLRRSKDNFAELLDDLGTRYNISQDDLYDIEDGVGDMVSGIQELAYVRGISDGMKLSEVVRSGRLPEKVLALLDDLLDEKGGGRDHSDTKLD